MNGPKTWGASGSKTVAKTSDLQKWSAAVTQKVVNPSTALQAVTAAFQAYEASKTQTNLSNFAEMLRVWRTTGPLKERGDLAGDANDLQLFIERAEKSNTVISVKASNVGQSKLYTLQLAPWPTNWAWCVALTVDLWPALKPADIAKLNEAFDRARRAAELARDAMTQVAKKSTLGPVLTPAEASYVEWFGAYDQGRAREVHSNFTDIVHAFDVSVLLYDVRNSDYGTECYAACFPGRVSRTKHRIGGKASTDRGALVTTQVKMLLGRSFFTGAKVAIRGMPGDGAKAYSDSTDATVGTMIHEMAHGTFKAVDAPIVLENGTWHLEPDLTAGDNYGASPQDRYQSSTPVRDRRLAIKDPTIAVRNADCYGQFARACLEREQG